MKKFYSSTTLLKMAGGEIHTQRISHLPLGGYLATSANEILMLFNVFDNVFFCKSNCKNVFSRFFKKREQFTDSAVTSNKTRR